MPVSQPQCIAPNVRAGLIIGHNHQIREVGQRSSALVNGDPSTTEADCEAVGDLDSPKIRNSLPLCGLLIEDRKNRVSCFVWIQRGQSMRRPSRTRVTCGPHRDKLSILPN